MGMTENETDKAFVRKVRDALGKGSDNLDSSIVRRLNRARFEALEAADEKDFGLWRWMNIRTAGALAVCGLVLTVGLVTYRWNGQPIHYAGVGDVEILAASDGLEIYEDLDFYTWLAQERDHAG